MAPNPPKMKDMYEASTLDRPNVEDEVTRNEGDQRAPIGKDAGAAEATGANAEAGGWQGGKFHPSVDIILNLN